MLIVYYRGHDEKIFIYTLLMGLALSFACSEESNDEISYAMNYTVTKDSDSSVVSQGSFTAGPEVEGHDGLPAASHYTDTDSNCFYFLATETAADSVDVDTIVNGSLDINGIFIILEKDGSTTGTWSNTNPNEIARIDDKVYDAYSSGSVSISEAGSANGGTVRGTFELHVLNESDEAYTISGSFTVKRGADDTAITN